MTEKELSIYNGLHLFRPEIAHFYKDGLEMKTSNLASKSNLLGHLLREIDSGLRGVLEVTERKEELKKQLPPNFYEDLFNDFKKEYVNFHYLSNVEMKDVKKYSGHIASIISAFDFSLDSQLAKKYIKNAIWFHKYAHRDDASIHSPRDPNDILKIWDEYEDNLFELVGNELPILDRIDTMIKDNTIDNNTLNRLPYLINTKTRKDYFFKKLKKTAWLSPLYEKGYFAGSANPSPIQVDMKDGNKGITFPRWEILDYLLFCANEFRDTNGDFTKILRVIDDIYSYQNPNGSRVLNPHTDDTIIRLISQLPNNKIEDKHFEYIDNIIKTPYNYSTISLEVLLKRLVNEKEKDNLLKCLNILFSYMKVENQIEQYNPVIEISFMIHIREKYGKDIINICGEEGLIVLLNNLEVIAQEDQLYDIHTIEDHSQNWNQYKYILQLVFFIRDFLIYLPSHNATELVVKFLSREKEIYRRLAYYIINVRYSDLKDVFWSLKSNPLDNIYNKHELFELIKKHQKEFSNSELKILLKWIKSISHKSLVEEENYDQILARSKKEWLLALEKIKSEDIEKARKKYSELYPYIIEHPGFISWTSSQVGLDSPISFEEIQSYTLSKTINKFSEFEKKEINPLHNLDIQGLSNIIEEDIINNIKKYTEDFDQILSSSIQFKYVWLMGIYRYIEKNDISFDILNFLFIAYKTIDNSDFWKKGNISFDYNEWFLNRFLSIVLILTEKDVFKSDIRIYNLLKGMLLYILRKNKVDFDDYSDLSHLSLNSSQGKLYEALVNLMIKKDYLDWDIKIEFESIFETVNGNPLLHYTFAKHLHQMWIKNKKWVSDNINILFPKNDLNNWKASMEGYHLHAGTVYSDIFMLLKINNHYDLFVENINLMGHISSEFIITHIVVAFDENIDGLNENDNLFKSIVSSNNIVIYKSVLNSLIRGIRNPSSKTVKTIWNKLWNICKDADSDAKKYLLKESYKLLDHIKNLDSEMEHWINSSSFYMDPYQARYFFRQLTPYVDKNIDIIGRIALNFVNTKDIPEGSGLEKIVEQMYKKGFTENADKICNTLASKGNNELRDIYNKYHIK